MKKIDRRSALKIGFAAASGAVVGPAAAQTTDALAGKDTSPWPGVVVRTYGESSSIIPGFKTVSMRDIIMQRGSKTASPPMPNAMVCHILEGEMRIDQDGKIFTAKKNFCWTCNKDTKGAGVQRRERRCCHADHGSDGLTSFCRKQLARVNRRGLG